MTETKKKKTNTSKPKETSIVYVGKDKISLATNGLATAEQVDLLASKTPKHFVLKRKGRGGKSFDYVNINYVIAKLNAIFGFDWDVEVLDKEIGANHVYVQVRLKVRFTDGHEIHKDAFGGSNVKRSGDNIIDISDDLKSAQSDGIKKAASMLGVAWDVYSGVTKAENGSVSSGSGSSNGKPQEEEKQYEEIDTSDAFRTIPLVMTDSSQRKVTKFEALKYFGKIKEAIGKDPYYDILGSAGYEKSNEIPEKDVPKIYTLMVKFYQELQDADEEAEDDLPF